MRIIAIILSLITLTLSSIPCDDNIVDITVQSTSIYQNSDHTDNNHIDLCSPFCSCVCCASLTVEPNINNVLVFDFLNKELNTHYVISLTTKTLTPIDQPPQV